MFTRLNQEEKETLFVYCFNFFRSKIKKAITCIFYGEKTIIFFELYVTIYFRKLQLFC